MNSGLKIEDDILSDVDEITTEELPVEIKQDFSIISSIELNLRSNLNLQNLWIVSHILTLIGTSLYVLCLVRNNPDLSKKCYRISILSSLFTYLVVLQRSRIEEEVQIYENQRVFVKTKYASLTNSLKNENAHLLGYIILWNFTKQSILKLIPFFIYSFLNISSFFILEVFPSSSLSIAVSPLLNFCEIPLLIVASYIDLFVIGVISKESFDDKDAYPFVIYFFIWLLRFENSEASRSSVGLIIRILDNYIFNSSLVSDSVKESWKQFRELLSEYFPLNNQNNDIDKEFIDSNDDILDDTSTITN